MVFQPGQTKTPWPSSGKLPIDNGGPEHTWLQVISGQVNFAGTTAATILNPLITATSQILLVPANGTSATLVYPSAITAGTGISLTAAANTTVYNYTIIG